MLEPYPGKTAAKLLTVIALLTAFALIYHLWPLSLLDLRSHEGFYAAQVQEMTQFQLVSTAHGVAIRNAFPLYPMLVARIVQCWNFPLELALRFFSVGVLFLAGLLAALTAANAKNFKAGCIAFAFTVSNMLVFDKLQYASPVTLTMFFVFSAQLAWFFFGIRHSKWTLAWLSSLSLIALAFLSGGFVVLAYFFIPLVLLPRPLTIWSRLRRWGFWLGLLVLCGVIGAWIWAYSTVPAPKQYAAMIWEGSGEYIWNVVKAPFSFFFRLLPWSLVVWMPFCSALWPLDDTPILSKYLRRTFVFEFCVLALNPMTVPSDYILLVGPAAVLSAIYYPIAVRRYSVQIRRLLIPCVYFGALCSAAIIAFCLLPDRWTIAVLGLPAAPFKRDPVFLATGLGIANLTLLLTFGIYFVRRKGQVYLALLATAVIAALGYWVMFHPYRAADHTKRELGETLRLALERDGAVDPAVFKLGIGDLYNECYYLNCPVIKIESSDELPSGRKVIYLITPPMTDFPSHLRRRWTNLLPAEFRYLDQDLRLLKGELIRETEPEVKNKSTELDLEYVPGEY